MRFGIAFPQVFRTLRETNPSQFHAIKNLHRRGSGWRQRTRDRRHHRLLENRTRGNPPFRQSRHRPARRFVLEHRRTLPRDPRRPAPRGGTPRRFHRVHRDRYLGLRPRLDRPGRLVARYAASIPRLALRGHGRGHARSDARGGNLRPHRHQDEFLQQFAASTCGGAEEKPGAFWSGSAAFCARSARLLAHRADGGRAHHRLHLAIVRPAQRRLGMGGDRCSRPATQNFR